MRKWKTQTRQPMPNPIRIGINIEQIKNLDKSRHKDACLMSNKVELIPATPIKLNVFFDSEDES